jgi:shikimate 5-dehydrogenase
MSQQNIRFIGVSTSKSSIMKIFPEWSKTLKLGASISGIDIPLNSAAKDYIDVINEMKNDPGCRGALVTTHKIALYQSARDMFSCFDDFAKICGEISCVKISSGVVEGFAKDPISAGRAINDFLPQDFFDSQCEVLLLGDGGAATAIAWYLTSLKNPPKMISVLGKDQSRLNHFMDVMKSRAAYIEFHLSSHSAIQSIISSGARFLIINATGMGKDLPGSPWPENLAFPKDSYLWELNYRGSLEFYHQGKAQEKSSNLKVIDGWRYFIYGWTQVISEVFDVDISDEDFKILEAQAEANR